MKTFNFTVKEPLGIHARPAGMLTKEAKNYKSTILLKKGDKEVNVLKLMALMKKAATAQKITQKHQKQDGQHGIERKRKNFFHSSYFDQQRQAGTLIALPCLCSLLSFLYIVIDDRHHQPHAIRSAHAGRYQYP